MEASNKQYLIANHYVTIQGMKEYPFGEGIHIFVGEGLRVVKGVTKGSIPYWLLGEAYCTNVFPRQVEEDLNSDVSGDVFAISRFWTGRWLLIFGKELITDASGLMSAFYVKNDSGWMVSSSLALISNQFGKDINKKVATSGLTWQLLPSTILDSAKALFCTQKMTLNKDLETCFYNRFAEWKELSYRERVSTITSCLVTGMRNIEKYSGEKIWLTLTAGKDSRLSFAAALSAGIKFETYTAKHRNMSVADRRLPEIISKKYGIKHHFLIQGRLSTTRFDEYCEFSGFNSLGADAEFYASGQFDQIPSDAVSIKSGLFEAGQVYSRSIAGGDEESFVAGIKNYYKTSFKDESQTDAFNEWIDYQRQNPMPGIDIRDRFYLEQRLNGWASAIEQSLTINPFVSIQIANSAIVLGCLLYAKSEDRKSLKLSYDMIRALDEKLLEYPVNQKCFRDRLRIIVNGIIRRIHL